MTAPVEWDWSSYNPLLPEQVIHGTMSMSGSSMLEGMNRSGHGQLRGICILGNQFGGSDNAGDVLGASGIGVEPLINGSGLPTIRSCLSRSSTAPCRCLVPPCWRA